MNRLAIWVIKSYQLMGGGRALNIDCNFLPSCSQYAETCFSRFGFWPALKLTFCRLRRCNISDLPNKISDPVPMPVERISL